MSGARDNGAPAHTLRLGSRALALVTHLLRTCDQTGTSPEATRKPLGQYIYALKRVPRLFCCSLVSWPLHQPKNQTFDVPTH